MKYIPRSSLSVERYADQLSRTRRGWVLRREDGTYYQFGFTSRAAAEQHTIHGNLTARFWVSDPKLIIFTLHGSLRASLSYEGVL